MINMLFVEDDPVVMANLRRSLQVYRHWNTRFAGSGDEALACLAEHVYDVVVSDLHMPGMTGLELLGMVKLMHPRSIRVLLAEPYESDTAVRGARVAHRFLRKPFDPAVLAVVVQRAFELEQRLNDPDLLAVVNQMDSLPSPTRTVIELNDLLGRPESSVDDIARVVEVDMGMTAKLLQVVNSAYFSLSHHVSDIREAIAYLGLEAVRNLLVASEMMNVFSAGPPLVEAAMEELHEHSLQVAHIAHELATNRQLANQAFVSALLHDVGLLVVASEMPDRFVQLRVQTLHSNLPLTEVEMEIVGAHHADIGAYLLDLWGLPWEIVEAVARHHDAPDVPGISFDAVHAVYIADALTSHLDAAGEGGWERQDELDAQYLERLGIGDAVYRLSAVAR